MIKSKYRTETMMTDNKTPKKRRDIRFEKEAKMLQKNLEKRKKQLQERAKLKATQNQEKSHGSD